MTNFINDDFLHTCGVVITVFNGALELLCLWLFFRELFLAYKSHDRSSIDFHYIMLFTIIAFGGANYWAYHRFYDSWVEARVKNIQIDLIIMAVKDRLAMCGTGIGLGLLSYKYKPSWFHNNNDEDDIYPL